MTTGCLKWLMIAGFAVAMSCAARAEDPEIGKLEFQSSCASCHGMDGKGKGPVSGQLKVPPADLTLLAKNNHGVFPADGVYEIIDGSKTVPAHGIREMPIWGERFNPIVSLPHDVDPSYWKLAGPDKDPATVIRRRILSVVDYVKLIQQK